jgi:biopolymer transport protein ExbD
MDYLPKGKIVHNRKKFDSINVVPFIDIMLVLLVIVLTTASFIQTGVIKLDLPEASAERIKEKPPKELKISIKKNGKIFFDKQEIEKENLENTLLRYNKKTPISLYCDKDVSFDKFVFLLDILKQNNYENLGIITKK